MPETSTEVPTTLQKYLRKWQQLLKLLQKCQQLLETVIEVPISWRYRIGIVNEWDVKKLLCLII